MQKKVVYTNERFLFLLAGAGSGKTRVVIERIKHLLKQGIDENDILALTFTHKAAEEMKHRIGHHDISIHTFHQFCLKELKKLTDYKYAIFQEDQTNFTKKELLSFTLYKNSMYKKRKPKTYHAYQRYLNDNQLKDFDDILLDYLAYMNTHKYQSYAYIFVDEFQDTNELQYHILKKLINQQTYVLCVGDPDQSIYQFRGADASIINMYIKDYNATVLKLLINYRSNKTIINHANRLIKRNYRVLKKDLIPYKTHTKAIESLTFMNTEQESSFTMDKISTWIKQDHIKPYEIAVLYRQHHRAFDLIHHFKTTHFNYYQPDINIKHKIHLLTMHQAKGLEFDAVIILGLESSIFPSSHTKTKYMLEEERRLMFVAITRAKEFLIYTHIKYNDYYQRQKPSIFIKESGLKNKIYKPISCH